MERSKSVCCWWLVTVWRGGHDPAPVRWYPGTSVTAPLPTNLCPPPAGRALPAPQTGSVQVYTGPAGRSAAPARAAAGPATSRLLPSTSDRAGPAQPGQGVSPVIVIAGYSDLAWLEAGEVPREDGEVGAGRPRPHTGHTPRHLQPPAPGLGAEED